MRILATGALLKCRPGVWQDGVWRAGPEFGDLDRPEAAAALSDWIAAEVTAAPPDAFAHDLHPDFPSTRLAQAWAAELGVPALAQQHHAAHLAVVAAEQGLEDGPLLGWALDGFGLGADARSAWGGELILLAGGSWQRLGQLRPLPQPGGERAAREPWRCAAAALHLLGRGAEIAARFPAQPLAAPLAALLERGNPLHAPPSFSAGRWFDAAAAALGLCALQAEEAQAARALQALAEQAPDCPLPALALPWRDGQLDPLPLLAALLDAEPSAAQARRFHRDLAAGLVAAAAEQAARLGLDGIALCGGCLYNGVLRADLRAALQARGLQARPPAEPGDAGLAQGQAWLAARQLQREALPCV